MATIPEQLALAIQHHQAGRLPAAEQVYRQVLAAEPNHADAIHLLGVMAHQAGKHEIAVQYIERAIALIPNFAEAHNNLGNVLKDQGQLDEAVACYCRALQLKPEYAVAHNNLGSAYQDQGKLDEAVACCRRALQLKPDFAEAYGNLSNAFKDQGKLDEAVAGYLQALVLKPDCPETYNNLATVRDEQGRLDEAVAGYRRALELRPAYAEAHFNLGTHYQQVADFESAQRCWREALRHDPLHARALAGLAMLLRADLPADELAALARLASSPQMTAGNRAALYFGMAYVTDDQGDHAVAARHFAEANSLSLADHRAHGHAYDPDAHDRSVAALIDAFSPAHFARVGGLGSDSQRPVFIFGLPRTGTTLTEQILAGHTNVFGAGELQLAGMAFESLPQITMKRATPLDCIAQLDRQTIGMVAGRYLERLETLDKCSLHIVDKMPDNYLHLGFLMTLFPKARFIHCRRDLRDVAVSCWMTNFRKIHWSNDVDHIAARFRAYDRLMEHWRGVLPAPMLEVDYETTVADLEGTARRLVDWCGLEWEPQCLSFHMRRDPVRTASLVQVRQPIYQHAVGRWKRYEDALAPLLGAVAARQGLA